MSKRKRSQADEAAVGLEDGPRKTRVVDAQDASQDDAKSRAAARQAKSERRSKKKDSKKQQTKPTTRIPDVTENLIPDQLPSTDGDHFSSNNDFVSLGDAPPAIPIVQTKKPKKPKASKGVSSQSSSKDAQGVQQHRFILFIGNLPFSTNNDAITHHFRALQPFTVRHMTDKKTNKSRGTAFLEFESYDKMKTCLKLYHHSLFDPDAHLHAAEDDNEVDSAPKDGQSSKRKKPTTSDPAPPAKDTKPQWQKPKADKTRRINVELTAGGGGGKSADRRKKIQVKNAKLAEERERFQRKEAEEREKKRVEGGGGGGGGGNKGTGANADASSGSAEAGLVDRGNVHPSRLQRVKG